MIELGLHLALRISTAQRLKLPKVRLEMIEIELAERLLDIIRREIDGQDQAGHFPLPRSGAGSR